MNVRQIVYDLLTKMDKEKAYSNIVLDNALDNARLFPKEKSFASALFYGVLERRLTLDYIIRKHSNVEFDDISAEALVLLRMGIYQLLYMNSVPDSAAVNECVNLAPHKVKGYVNGVLRSFIRAKKLLDLTGLEGEAALSVEYSCPKWLVKKWIREYGEEKALIALKASLGKPPVYVRANTVKYTVDEVFEQLKKEKFNPVRNTLLPECIEVKTPHAIDASNAFRKGMFHVQDISSQICAMALKPFQGETVMDFCAAPGGKSFTIAEIMNNKGKLYSFDLHEGKIWLLENGAKRLGLDIIIAKRNDATIYDESLPMADKVLCDVPCSGLGVIGRKPEIKYKKFDFIDAFPEIQLKILTTAAKHVKPGGTLVYSTCTLNKAENEGVVEAFLKDNKDFSPVVVPLGIEKVENSYMRTIFPNQYGGDGFFFATMRKVKPQKVGVDASEFRNGRMYGKKRG